MNAKELRCRLDISIRDFAEITGVSVSTLQSAEKGVITQATADKISEATGISSAWLISGDPAKPISRENEPYSVESYREHRRKLFINERQPIVEATFEAVKNRLEMAFTVLPADAVTNAVIDFLVGLDRKRKDVEERAARIAELRNRLAELEAKRDP